jgi:hypothetical protein
MNGMARLASWLRHAALIATATVLSAVTIPAVAGVDLPLLEKGKGDKCVEETQYMRRNHMDLLKHQRDETMRKGIRTTQHSLKQCVECHVSEKTGSVAASKEDFCVACHAYASVKLDCWECHATKPGKKSQTKVNPHALKPRASPLLTSRLDGAGK